MSRQRQKPLPGREQVINTTSQKQEQYKQDMISCDVDDRNRKSVNDRDATLEPQHQSHPPT